MAVVPTIGSYLLRPGDDGSLWQVAAVVYGPTVDAYVVRVSPLLAGELLAAWATWSEPAVMAEGLASTTG